ncbi:hypothetical protein LLE49_07280 [Alicyclobacillus tolerans]|uniref:hypothetical protein n=1 Tax=Alicyclobacillus tolerans TaxID=90970 RepID=UPI001F1E54B9|nr:hypothetical protein [Alicyclobacillus tolerans]MCF8564546.1 hypothetical protein [Alicyclobacillus tolerans]
MRGEVRKVVVFNVGNESDRKLYEYAQSVNFTRLVKSYLARELRKSAKPTNEIKVNLEG